MGVNPQPRCLSFPESSGIVPSWLGVPCSPLHCTHQSLRLSPHHLFLMGQLNEQCVDEVTLQPPWPSPSFKEQTQTVAN